MAARLGEGLFVHYRSRKNPEKVLLSRLTIGFGERTSRKIRAFFDPDNQGSLTKDELVARCVNAYEARKNFAMTLSDLASLLSSLSHFLDGAIGVLTFILLTIVFSTGSFADITVGLGGTLFALSFIFSTTASNIFVSFSFIFLRHPFDVGM